MARLSYDTKETDLEREFGRFGPIERVNLLDTSTVVVGAIANMQSARYELSQIRTGLRMVRNRRRKRRIEAMPL